MPLVSSLVLPHGAMTFDGGEGCTVSAAKRINTLPDAMKGDCQTLFRSSQEAATIAKATNPDVIFLSTPHGICLSHTHCVYLNPRAKGNAEWNDQWMEYDVNIVLDTELATEFLKHLQNDSIPAEGMVSYSGCETPLRWGEVIPLWFFRDLAAAGMKFVIFSEPFKTKHLPLADAAKVGHSIAKFLGGLKQRVLYIVSGDLAHSHETDCKLPLYLPDPRWNLPTSEVALTFDLCVEHWVKCTPLESADLSGPQKTNEKCSTVWDEASSSIAEHWLSKATELKSVALSCGIYGIGILHGVLCTEVKENATFDAHLLCRLAPTYYGMAVAAFIKKTEKK